MTDAEKMMQLMMAMGAEAKEQAQTQMDNASNMLKMQHDSFIKAGFSPKMAFELIKTMLSSAFQGATKK